MLTKGFSQSYTPASPGSPATPGKAAYSVCQQAPAPGYWNTVCSEHSIVSATGTGVRLPPGAVILKAQTIPGVQPGTGQGFVVTYRLCTTSWKQTGPPGAKKCTNYPAQPAKPATPATPAKVVTTATSAWDAGANSEAVEAGDCECVFTMKQVSGVRIGFTSLPEAVPGLSRLSHSLHFSGRSFQVLEASIGRNAAAPFTDGDEFRIRRVGSTVSYIHNGSTVYTSAVPSTGEVRVGCALYASGDYIE